MAKLKQTLRELDEQWVSRLLGRLKGLTDDEYLWEPVANSWSIRRSADGTWLTEWEHPEPDPAPLTTIAARLWHLGARPWPVPPSDSVAEAVRRQFVAPYAPTAHTDREACASPADAAASIEQQWVDRRAWLDAVTEEDLLTPLGPKARQYASACWFDLELHFLDERIHHAAEVGLMRDLYRVRAELRGSP